MRSITKMILVVVLSTCSFLTRIIRFFYSLFLPVSSWVSLTMWGIQFHRWLLNFRDNLKKCKYFRWCFEEWLFRPSGWNLSTGSQRAVMGEELPMPTLDQSLPRILRLKIMPEGIEKVLGRERGFLIINQSPHQVQYCYSGPWKMTCYFPFLLNMTKAKARTKWWILNIEYSKKICHLLSIRWLSSKKKQAG